MMQFSLLEMNRDFNNIHSLSTTINNIQYYHVLGTWSMIPISIAPLSQT